MTFSEHVRQLRLDIAVQLEQAENLGRFERWLVRRRLLKAWTYLDRAEDSMHERMQTILGPFVAKILADRP